MSSPITVHGYQGLPRVAQLHQALGGYFETYSIGLATMRHAVEDFLSFPAMARFKRNPLFDVLFAGMTAKPLADAFFSMCTIAGSLNGSDLKIRNALRANWTDHTAFRNDLAHAEWNVGWETMDGKPVPPSAMRIKVRDGLPTLTNLAIDTNDIIHRINDLQRTNDLLRAFSGACQERQAGEVVNFTDRFELVEPVDEKPRRLILREKLPSESEESPNAGDEEPEITDPS